MEKTLGLIAGNGGLPKLVAREAKKAGYRVIVSGIQGEVDSTLSSSVDRMESVRLGQLGQVIKFFKSEGVTEAVLAGKITKTNLFRGDIRPDLEMIKALATTRNHSDGSLLGGIVKHLEKRGIHVVDTTRYLSEDALPESGVLTKRRPSKQELEDIEFGWRLAKEIGRLDIGQTVVVKNKAVLAVEAIEGTDEAIIRGGNLGNGDAVIVKVAKPKQDMRFDIPTIGLGTIDAMIQARARVLAFEGGKTIILDRENLMRKADEYKLSILAKEK